MSCCTCQREISRRAISRSRPERDRQRLPGFDHHVHGLAAAVANHHTDRQPDVAVDLVTRELFEGEPLAIRRRLVGSRTATIRGRRRRRAEQESRSRHRADRVGEDSSSVVTRVVGEQIRDVRDHRYRFGDVVVWAWRAPR